MGGRGGRRPGAGRKNLIEFDQRIEIGAECDKRSKSYADADQRARIEAKFSGDEMVEMRNAIHAVHPRLVNKRTGETGRQAVSRLASSETIPIEGTDEAGVRRHSDPKLSEGYPDEVILAAVALRSRRETIAKRRNYDSGGRPYGHRDRVLEDVAAWATERFGRLVSRRQVDACWKEYRSTFTSDDRE